MSDSLRPGWISCSFSALCQQIVNGGTPDTGNPSYWNGTTPWITGADFTERGIGEFRRYVSGSGIRGSATSVVRQGNLLVVTRTGVGKIAIAPCDIAISQDVTGIYLDSDKVEINFAYYLLKRELDELKKLNQGTSINGIVRSDLERHRVQIPESKITQAKIARVLLRIDSAIEKTEALIEKYQQIKSGLMHDLFTRGVQPDGKLRPTREQEPELYRETGIGWIPKEWGIQKVEDCGEVKLGRQRSPDRHSGKWTTPYLRVANVLDGVIDYGDVLEMDFTPTERKLFELYPGDILLNEGQSLELVGRSAIYRGEPGQFCFQNTLVRFRCTPDNHASFFAHLFKLWLDRGAFQIISKQTTSVAHLGADRFAKMVCPKIGLHEQKIIAQRLNSVDERIAKTEAHRKNLAYQKAGLMHDLLTGKVAVKVDSSIEQGA